MSGSFLDILSPPYTARTRICSAPVMALPLVSILAGSNTAISSHRAANDRALPVDHGIVGILGIRGAGDMTALH